MHGAAVAKPRLLFFDNHSLTRNFYHTAMTYVALPNCLALAASAFLLAPVAAAAQERARVTGLSDVDFGIVTSLTDTARSQSVCAFTSSSIEQYSVTASGDGPGGSFVLAAGPFELAYDVLWSDATGVTGGSLLAPNAATPGFVSTVKQHRCNSGPPTSASLTIRLRGQVLQNARAGSYAGVLSITLAPE